MDIGTRDEKALSEEEGTYTNGMCHVMALALNERFGLDIGVILNPGAPGLPKDDFGVVHCFVWVDNERVLDITGIRTLKEMTKSWGLSPRSRRWSVEDYEPHRLHGMCPCTEEELRDADEAFRRVFPDCVLAPSPVM